MGWGVVAHKILETAQSIQPRVQNPLSPHMEVYFKNNIQEASFVFFLTHQPTSIASLTNDIQADKPDRV